MQLKCSGVSANMSSNINTSSVSRRNEILYGKPFAASFTPKRNAAKTFSDLVMVSGNSFPHELQIVKVYAQTFPQAVHIFMSFQRHCSISGCLSCRLAIVQ